MRLTLSLLKRKMPPGNIWLGKNRLAHHIYPDNIERMVKRLQIEEKNLLYLRHPYLTLEQERTFKDYTKEQRGHELLTKRKFRYVASRMEPSVPMEHKLGHLLHGEKWDV